MAFTRDRRPEGHKTIVYIYICTQCVQFNWKNSNVAKCVSFLKSKLILTMSLRRVIEQQQVVCLGVLGFHKFFFYDLSSGVQVLQVQHTCGRRHQCLYIYYLNWNSINIFACLLTLRNIFICFLFHLSHFLTKDIARVLIHRITLKNTSISSVKRSTQISFSKTTKIYFFNYTTYS